MRVRPVTAADRGEWLRMRMDLFPDSSPDEVDAWLAGNPESKRTVGIAVLVADPGTGALTGFVEIGERSYAEGCYSGRVAYLEGWYVDPEFRRQGIGRALLAAAETWAAGQEFTEMASDSLLTNATSIGAHRALGYEEVERQVCFRKSLQR